MKPIASLFVLADYLTVALLPGSSRADDQAKPPARPTAPKDDPIDYQALLNDRLAKGVTPEKNAMVQLWKAFGPTPAGAKRMPAEYFKRLGASEPPALGEFFTRLNFDEKDPNYWYERENAATRHPWKEADYPEIAAWLKANEKPLAVILEASRRPDFYDPVVPHPEGDQPGLLIGALMPVIASCWDVADALAARAMLAVGKGDFVAARRDLVACHRLGRLVGRGATALPAIVGIALDKKATEAELAYLESSGQSAEVLLERLKELRALPPLPVLADKIDLADRIVFLQSLQWLRSNAARSLGIVGDEKDLSEEDRKVLAAIDWNPAIQNANRMYDRVAAAMRFADRQARQREFDNIVKDMKAASERATGAGTILRLLRSKTAPAAAGEAIGNIILKLMMLDFPKLAERQDQATQTERNLHVAFALAAYKADHGEYPPKLAELSPKYLAAIPNDLFSDKPLFYKPIEKGYLLYSVGPDGKDDGGRSVDDDPRGDDIVVRMPLPSLKKP